MKLAALYMKMLERIAVALEAHAELQGEMFSFQVRNDQEQAERLSESLRQMRAMRNELNADRICEKCHALYSPTEDQGD